MKNYFNTNQFRSLPVFGPHPKSHGARGVSKHYHLRFDPKIGNGICEIFRIPCACVACTSMLGQPWIYVISSNKQARYQPVINCTYWTVLVSFNNCNIIHLSQKSTPFEAFEEIHQVVINVISDNISSLLQYDKYGTINTSDTTTDGYYVLKFISEAYTLKNNTTIDRQMITAGELIVKEQYIFSMQYITH